MNNHECWTKGIRKLKDKDTKGEIKTALTACTCAHMHTHKYKLLFTQELKTVANWTFLVSWLWSYNACPDASNLLAFVGVIQCNEAGGEALLTLSCNLINSPNSYQLATAIFPGGMCQSFNKHWMILWKGSVLGRCSLESSRGELRIVGNDMKVLKRDDEATQRRLRFD